MTSKIRNKNGFSIAEVVVALAIIVIVSIASMSIVSSAITARENAINETKAQNFAYNMLECFKASKNLSDFKNNVIFAEGVDLAISGASDQATYATYEYESQKNNFKAEITVKFPDPNTQRPRFEIDVKDGKEKVLISFWYEKGV